MLTASVNAGTKTIRKSWPRSPPRDSVPRGEQLKHTRESRASPSPVCATSSARQRFRPPPRPLFHLFPSSRARRAALSKMSRLHLNPWGLDLCRGGVHALAVAQRRLSPGLFAASASARRGLIRCATPRSAVKRPRCISAGDGWPGGSSLFAFFRCRPRSSGVGKRETQLRAIFHLAIEAERFAHRPSSPVVSQVPPARGNSESSSGFDKFVDGCFALVGDFSAVPVVDGNLLRGELYGFDLIALCKR